VSFIDSFESTKQCHLEISLTSRKPSKVSLPGGPGIEYKVRTPFLRRGSLPVALLLARGREQSLIIEEEKKN
jgi:hypothetical protein